MKIVVDAMGGDYAPQSSIEGAFLAIENLTTDIILTGNKQVISEYINKKSVLKKQFTKYLNSGRLKIVHASQTIEMNDIPAEALKLKKRSSVWIACELLKNKEANGIVSAGNTGAIMATAIVVLGKLPNVLRPALAVTIPSLKEPVCLLDVGANVNCRPAHLASFALMGKVYAEKVLNRKNPKVGLLNIGTESTKGNSVTKSAYSLISRLPINFIGNVEGHTIITGGVDVVVTDGFVGNVVLKFGEGLATMMLTELKRKTDEIDKFKKIFLEMQKKLDYSEYGGALLLGVNGTCVICHGRSDAKAIMNGIRLAYESIQQKIEEYLKEEFNKIIFS